MADYDRRRTYNFWNRDCLVIGKRYLVADSEEELVDRVRAWDPDEESKTVIITQAEMGEFTTYPFHTSNGDIYGWAYLVDDLIEYPESEPEEKDTIEIEVHQIFTMSQDKKYFCVRDQEAVIVIRISNIFAAVTTNGTKEHPFGIRIDTQDDASNYFQFNSESERDFVFNKIMEVLGFGDEQI